MSNNQPLVSVIIPSFNRADTVVLAIQSALDQEVPSIEVIVIDDGSSDHTQQAVSGLHHPAVKFLRQKNSGANVARNRGIEAATGAYIALLDSDDTFLPGHLARSVAHLRANPSSAVFAKIIVDRGHGNTFLKPPRAPHADEPISEYLSCAPGFVQTSTVVLPSEAAEKVRYLEWLPYGQDVDFAIRLEQAGFKLHMIQEPGAIWNDVKNGARISAKTDPKVRMKWAIEERHLLTDRAFRGFTGWRVAKAYAENGKTMQGLLLWLRAAASGAYTPKHALVVFLQVLLAHGWYRKLADLRVKRSAKKVKEL